MKDESGQGAVLLVVILVLVVVAVFILIPILRECVEGLMSFPLP